MKTKKIDFDIDFIGGEGVLTKTEEMALSQFFKQKKLNRKKTAVQSGAITNRSKLIC
jgi:hypothetical protein